MKGLAALAAALLLSACALQPMYAGGASSPVARGLASVEVAPIEGRAGWLVRNALVDRLSLGGQGDARYRLEVRLDDSIQGLGVLNDDAISRERRTIFSRPEPDHRVDGQGRQTRFRRRVAGDRPDLGNVPSIHGDQIRSREAIGDLVRIADRARQHVGSNHEVSRRTPHQPFGDTAPHTFFGQLDQPMGLQSLQVIVHLLTGRPNRRGDRCRRRWFI